MLVDERRNNILQTIENKGFVGLSELVDLVQASESTIRRDLEYLDSCGHIRRTRGGAAYVGASLTPFEDRSSQATREKRLIAEAAANLIEPGETVLLDGGTTTLELAKQLVGIPLQVVTNSLPIINVLANQAEIDVMVIGGYLYPKTGVALGPAAIASLKNVHVHRLFVSVGGITEIGLFNSNALLVETERQMLEVADEIVVLSDSNKFGRSALANLCPLERVDRIVTDSAITDEWKQRLQSAGINLTIVEI